MIAVQSENGELIKVLKNVTEGEFGFHRYFGIISKGCAEKRVETRKRQCFDYTNNEWLCSFTLHHDAKILKLLPLAGCEASESKDGWKLKTPMGTFYISTDPGLQIPPLLEGHSDKNTWQYNLLLITFFLAFLFTPAIYFKNMNTPSKKMDEEKILDPISVKITQKMDTVRLEPMNFPRSDISVSPSTTAKPTSTQVITQRVLQKDLGFLSMANSKNLNAVGSGAPQNLKQLDGDSIGTGRGKGAGMGTGSGIGSGETNGNASAGGQLLTGFGKGLRRANSGNGVGVQGLGGIGTKGTGGGNGGYGKNLVASGEGKGISGIAVSNNDMILEGGISRYAINATIAKYTNQVRRCYEAELKNHPEIQGLIEMNFEINADGKLNFSKVSKSTINNTAIESCISTRMMEWQFPRPKGGVNVNVKYPFMLRPVGV